MTTAAKKKTHGGAGRKQGRKPLEEGSESKVVPIRMSVDQKEKLGKLGGAKWVRAKIDNAKEPE